MSRSNRPHSTARALPEAILFGLTDHGDQRSGAEVLAELAQLADTGEFQVVGGLAQHRRSPDPNTYLGRGKLDELTELVQAAEANVVICDESLSPAQGRSIEKTVGVPVLDRSELILHIFATHAQTPP